MGPGTVGRARSRRRLLSWVPISVVALLCVGFVVAAIAMQNSWWTDPERAPDSDQQASDGASLFTESGVDYLTRQGMLRVKVRADALPASELGLEPDGSQSFEPLVPIQAVVLGADGAFHLDLVRSFTVTTADDRVQSIDLEQESNGDWLSAFPNLERMAPSWGWTPADLDKLKNDLTAASRQTDSDSYSAQTPPIERNGALVSARIDVDVAAANVTVVFTVSSLEP